MGKKADSVALRELEQDARMKELSASTRTTLWAVAVAVALLPVYHFNANFGFDVTEVPNAVVAGLVFIGCAFALQSTYTQLATLYASKAIDGSSVTRKDAASRGMSQDDLRNAQVANLKSINVAWSVFYTNAMYLLPFAVMSLYALRSYTPGVNLALSTLVAAALCMFVGKNAK